VAHAFLLVFPSVVAVYLKESWWSIEDILRTSDPTREGLMKVRGYDFKSIFAKQVFKVSFLGPMLIN
jgi:hypothetical protein